MTIVGALCAFVYVVTAKTITHKTRGTGAAVAAILVRTYGVGMTCVFTTGAFIDVITAKTIALKTLTAGAIVAPLCIRACCIFAARMQVVDAFIDIYAVVAISIVTIVTATGIIRPHAGVASGVLSAIMRAGIAGVGLLKQGLEVDYAATHNFAGDGSIVPAVGHQGLLHFERGCLW